MNLLRRDFPTTTRVQKWVLRLEEYNLRIEYKRGCAIIIADLLSRILFASAVSRNQETAPTEPVEQLHRGSVKLLESIPEQFRTTAIGFFFFSSGAEDLEENDKKNE